MIKVEQEQIDLKKIMVTTEKIDEWIHELTNEWMSIKELLTEMQNLWIITVPASNVETVTFAGLP